MDGFTGEILAEAGSKVDKVLANKIQNAGVPFVWIETEQRNVKVLSNLMVELGEWIDFDPASVGVTELVYYPVLQKILEENTNDEDIKDAIHKNIHELIPKHITCLLYTSPSPRD